MKLGCWTSGGNSPRSDRIKSRPRRHGPLRLSVWVENNLCTLLKTFDSRSLQWLLTLNPESRYRDFPRIEIASVVNGQPVPPCARVCLSIAYRTSTSSCLCCLVCVFGDASCWQRQRSLALLWASNSMLQKGSADNLPFGCRVKSRGC